MPVLSPPLPSPPPPPFPPASSGIASPSSVLVTATRSAPPSNARRFSNDPHEQALYDAVAAVQAPAVNAIRGSITLFGQEERLAIEREKKAQIRRDLGE